MTTQSKVKRSPTVVKVGGAKLRDPDHVSQLSRYVARLRDAGEPVVVVHGGGPEIGELHESLGVPFIKHQGLRVTSEASMPLVTMVLSGLVNKRVVARLVADGTDAVGICGVDRGLMRSSFLNQEQLGRVGGPPTVSDAVLGQVLGDGVVPVIAPVCLGPDGGPVNVNADTAAHAIATSLKAATLDFVTDVPGVRTATEAAVRRLDPAEVNRLIEDAQVTGGMIPKLQAALAAIDAGVGRVRIGDLESMQRDEATEVIG